VLARGADAAPAAAPVVPAAASAAPVAAAAPTASPPPVAATAESAAPPAESAPPAGPVTLERLRAAWPAVLTRLEDISRTSWLIASSADVVGLDDDVLTLAFTSQTDVVKFKQRSAGGGPSEDLRQAILAVLGIRVKYLAKHEDAAPEAGTAPAAPPAPATPTPAAPPASSGSRGGPAPARASAPAAAAPVTEWAVAPIPSDADAPPPDPGPPATPSGTAPSGQFAVDDEPEDAAARTRTATLAPVREGDVLRSSDVAPSIERDDDAEDAETDAAADLPVPPVVAPPLPPVASTRSDGVQRYGEAVVRQVLGATFLREEPYEPPTRFS